MKIAAALALLAGFASSAQAEGWCISRTGRLRLRPNGCFTQLYERPFVFGLSTGSGTRSLAVVDKDGELIGHVTDVGAGYDFATHNVIVMRQVGAQTYGLPVNDRGLVPPGIDVVYFAQPGCVGEPLLFDQGDARNGLLKVGGVWSRDQAWFPSGTSHPATIASYVIPLPDHQMCSDFQGTVLTDDLCCLADSAVGNWFTAQPFTLSGAGLEPPFRLSVEP